MKLEKPNSNLFCGLFLVASLCLYALPLEAKTFALGTEYSSNYKPAEPIFTPEPEISPELHEQCFKSCCIAKFLIKKDGKTSVQLLSTSGSQDVDEIALHALRQWTFKPATLDGKPVDSSRKIKVEFEVE
jgi:periplasmic protein TonB